MDLLKSNIKKNSTISWKNKVCKIIRSISILKLLELSEIK